MSGLDGMFEHDNDNTEPDATWPEPIDPSEDSAVDKKHRVPSEAVPADAIECPAFVAAYMEASHILSDDVGTRATDSADIRALGKQWSDMVLLESTLDMDDASESCAGLHEVTEVGEELSACVAAALSAEAESWRFTLDVGSLGYIDGQVSMETQQIRIELSPRNREFARFLRIHKRTLEEIASRECQDGIVLSIV